MDNVYVNNEDINGVSSALAKGEYEDCHFGNCMLSSSSLDRISFVECVFENCDLSMANINGTAFKEVKFKNCKMLGLHFEQANDFLFSVDFDSCQLNLSSFYNCSLKKTSFKNCNLSEVDLAGADLTGSTFENCDLQGAIFDNTILEKADLRSSFGFMIDPEANRVKKAKFALASLPGLLGKYDIEIV